MQSNAEIQWQHSQDDLSPKSRYIPPPPDSSPSQTPRPICDPPKIKIMEPHSPPAAPMPDNNYPNVSHSFPFFCHIRIHHYDKLFLLSTGTLSNSIFGNVLSLRRRLGRLTSSSSHIASVGRRLSSSVGGGVVFAVVVVVDVDMVLKLSVDPHGDMANGMRCGECGRESKWWPWGVQPWSIIVAAAMRRVSLRCFLERRFLAGHSFVSPNWWSMMTESRWEQFLL